MFKQALITAFAVLFLSFGSAFAADKINLNTATVEELQTLDGVGPATAAAIIEYRQELGKFKTVDQLTEVKGIGEKKMQKLADKVSVSE